MSGFFLSSRDMAKIQEMVRWFDSQTNTARRGQPDPFANHLVPFELTADPRPTAEIWLAKGKPLYFDVERGYEFNAAVNDFEADIYFPLSKDVPSYKNGGRLFCVYRGRWEAFEGGISIHCGHVVTQIHAGIDPKNAHHGGKVKEDNSETEFRAFAGMLDAGESISAGRRVEWLALGGVNRIINAECE